MRMGMVTVGMGQPSGGKWNRLLQRQCVLFPLFFTTVLHGYRGQAGDVPAGCLPVLLSHMPPWLARLEVKRWKANLVSGALTAEIFN